MIDLNNELVKEYLGECREHLATIKLDLLAARKGGADKELLNRVFWAVRSVRGAGLFGLANIRDLAQKMEDVLELIIAHKMVPTPYRILTLMRVTDRLYLLFQDPGSSNRADITDIISTLSDLCADHWAYAKRQRSKDSQARQEGWRPRVLLVEDDAASRLLLQTFLSRYGECHVAVNGKEGLEAFHAAMKREEHYDLVCMDIMMPEMDGHEAVRQVRALEEAHGIPSTSGAKIIMTTAVEDLKEVIQCLRDRSDGYLLKPIDLSKLLLEMKSHHLVP